MSDFPKECTYDCMRDIAVGGCNGCPHSQVEKLKAELAKYQWTSVEDQPIPKDGEEYLVKNMNQGGVKSLISWNIIHDHWQEKNTPSWHQSTHWMPIPELPESEDK